LTGAGFLIIPGGGADFSKRLSRGDIRELGISLSEAAILPTATLSADKNGLTGAIEAVGYWIDFVQGRYSKPGKVITVGDAYGSGINVVIESVDGQQDKHRCRFVFRVRTPLRGEVENADLGSDANPYPEFFDVRHSLRAYSYQVPRYDVSTWTTDSPYSFGSIFAVGAPVSSGVIRTLTGYDQRTRYYNQFTIQIWQSFPVYRQPRRDPGVPIGESKTIYVPGFGTYTGTCKDCNSDPHPVSGWINKYVLETVGADIYG